MPLKIDCLACDRETEHTKVDETASIVKYRCLECEGQTYIEKGA